LHVERHVADLVEEQGSAVGLFESSDPLAISAGERSFLVAEQFAFEQVFVECGTVDRDELPRPLLDGCLMNRPRHLLFARARLARDQHRRGRIRNLADQFEDVVHFRALAQHVEEAVLAVDLLAQRDDFILQRSFAQGALGQENESLRVGRFEKEIVRPELHCLDRVRNRAVPGGDDDGARELFLLNIVDQLHAGRPWAFSSR